VESPAVVAPAVVRAVVANLVVVAETVAVNPARHPHKATVICIFGH
jgi:hypothetical protein